MDAPDKDKDKTEQDDKGFAVHDKRRIGKEGAPDSGYTPPETVTEEIPRPTSAPRPNLPGRHPAKRRRPGRRVDRPKRHMPGPRPLPDTGNGPICP